ncbi:unnamed protein product, partial [Ascophyllum nodosum]
MACSFHGALWHITRHKQTWHYYDVSPRCAPPRSYIVWRILHLSRTTQPMSWVRVAAGHAMGSADEGEAKADGDTAGGFSPTVNGTPGAGAAVKTAKGIAETIATGETKTMKPSARFDSASSAAEVDGRQKQQQ